MFTVSWQLRFSYSSCLNCFQEVLPSIVLEVTGFYMNFINVILLGNVSCNFRSLCFLRNFSTATCWQHLPFAGNSMASTCLNFQFQMYPSYFYNQLINFAKGEKSCHLATPPALAYN